MLNYRLINTPKEPEAFVKVVVKFLRKYAMDKKVFCALSGGIDSSTVYLLLKRAEIETLPVFIDHGLMRIIRGLEEREYIKKMFPDTLILDVREEFLPKIYGEGDAEVKRKLFKNLYSDIISKTIKEENCDLLADGTILPDIEESFGVDISKLKETMSTSEENKLMKKYSEKFVKSQHNVGIEYNVEATIQPIASLTKAEVREILKYFKTSQELIYRKAFPGPALAARIIGPVTEKNLAFEKKVHDLIETQINDYYIKTHGKAMLINENGEQEPFQAFAAITNDAVRNKVTGIIEGKRSYEYPLIVKGVYKYSALTQLASKLKRYSRLLYEIHYSPTGDFDVIIRCVNSKDARTASVTNLPLPLLEKIKELLIKLPQTKCVYYDVTPKRPATIEYV